MLGTERGLTWLARWHSTTPSVRAAPKSLGSDTLRRASIFWTDRYTWSLTWTSLEPSTKRGPKNLYFLPHSNHNTPYFTVIPNYPRWTWKTISGWGSPFEADPPVLRLLQLEEELQDFPPGSEVQHHLKGEDTILNFHQSQKRAKAKQRTHLSVSLLSGWDETENFLVSKWVIDKRSWPLKWGKKGTGWLNKNRKM